MTGSFGGRLKSSLMFFSFAAGRVFGLVADGFPGDQVMQGLISEIVMGSGALILLIKTRAGEGLGAQTSTASSNAHHESLIGSERIGG